MWEEAFAPGPNPMLPDMITDDFPVPGKIARDH